MQHEWSGTFGVIDPKKVSADVVAARIKTMRASHGEIISPIAIVNAARPSRSVMHPLFEWDDSVAGEKWRVHQGRFVLNSLRVIVRENNDDEPISVVANIHIQNDGDGYVSVQAVFKNPEYLEKAEAEAMRYLEGFQSRFNFLHNNPKLRRIFEALEELNGEE